MPQNINVIDPNDLYNTLLGFTYLKNKLSQYYIISERENLDENWDDIFLKIETLLKNNDWQNKKKYQKDKFIYKAYGGSEVETITSTVENNEADDNEEKTFSKWRGVEFYYGIFYSEDFDCIIISDHYDRTDEILEKLKKTFELIGKGCGNYVASFLLQ